MSFFIGGKERMGLNAQQMWAPKAISGNPSCIKTCWCGRKSASIIDSSNAWLSFQNHKDSNDFGRDAHGSTMCPLGLTRSSA